MTPVRVGDLPPPEVTDWRAVTLSGMALAAVVGAFMLALKNAGRAAR